MDNIRIVGEQKPLTVDQIRMASEEARKVELYFNELDNRRVVIDVEVVEANPLIRKETE